MVINVIYNKKKNLKREPRDDGSALISISELLFNTVQGENFSGFPSVILRLKGCTQSCIFCDSRETWSNGESYSVWELVEIMKKYSIVDKLKAGHHLIITGGSPLLQQDAILDMIDFFQEKFKFKPFIEMENECVILPYEELITEVNLWNNSPKLANSGNSLDKRYKPEVIKRMAELENSFFKFVISKEKDWDEIKELFLDNDLIQREKIVLMPEGSTREQLQDKYDWLVELCCRENVRMSDRLHVTIWDSKKGV